MMTRSIAQARVHLDAIPIGPGPQGLWTFLQSLLRSMNTRYDFSVNFLITWYELQVPELRALARQRTRAVIAELDRRLPRGAPAGAAPLLHAVIAGAATQWTTEPRGTLADYVLAQLAAHAAPDVPLAPDALRAPAPPPPGPAAMTPGGALPGATGSGPRRGQCSTAEQISTRNPLRSRT
jgi:TetR/AcrR family macrolide resistance operon transcriptional repressor